MIVKGCCNCGTVSFEVLETVSDVYVCHCSICRKLTGSGGIAVTIVDKTKFRWIDGHNEVKTWHKQNYDWQANFCGVCGSPLPVDNDESSIAIPVSLLDVGYEQLEVKHHIFVNSKPSWEKISDAGIQHPDNYSNKNT